MASGWKKAIVGISSLALIAVAGDYIVNHSKFKNTIPSRYASSFYQCDNGPLCNLSQGETKELIDSLDTFIHTEYAQIIKNSGQTIDEAKKAKDALETKIDEFGLDIDLFSKGRKIDFEDIGYVFDVSTPILDRYNDKKTYEIGKIIKEEYDVDSGANIIHYSSEKFAQTLEFTLKKIAIPLWKKGDSIYINHHMVENDAAYVFDIFNIIKKENPQLPDHEMFMFLDYKRIQKDNPNREEFINAYASNTINSDLTHEKSHIKHGLRNRVESETVAFLEQLENTPTYSTFAVISSFPDSTIISNAGGKILTWFEEFGYDKETLYTTPLETIGNVAGKILDNYYPELR